ncbi:MAG: hypothetical protein MJZ76_03265, partial [Bacteroidales bacterium]|nr:hypothetical protein [Bacteroidales bacterium]
CGKKEKTNTDKLCIEKGWVLKAATSQPAYVMLDGTQIADLFDGGYLEPGEKDDIIAFSANGTQVIKPGDNLNGGYQQEVGGYKWFFNNDESILNFYVPFFYKEAADVVDEGTIVSLTETELKVNVKVNDDDPYTKGNYTFTLTYVPVK